METALQSVMEDMAGRFGLDYMTLVQTYSARIKAISDEFEDPDIHFRCRGRNKNNKRCSKAKKENSEFCAIHYIQHMDEEREGGGGGEYFNTLDFVPAAAAAAAAETAMTAASPASASASASASAAAVAPPPFTIRLLETSASKKKGVFPEQIKKITHEGLYYYMNKNNWVYEMNQETEMILSDMPIGKMFQGKFLRIQLV
jgi:hypothetical protein